MNAKICPPWFGVVLGHRLRRLIQKPEQILEGLIAPGQVVVDLGCGPGFFTLPMAKIVGVNGRVIAADVQQTMLDMVRRRARLAGLEPRITLHLTSTEQIGINEKVDFVLAFWMVHEVEDKVAFLRQVHQLLKPAALFLLAEPTAHVKESEFRDIVGLVEKAGFGLHSEPRILISRAVLFRRQ